MENNNNINTVHESKQKRTEICPESFNLGGQKQYKIMNI